MNKIKKLLVIHFLGFGFYTVPLTLRKNLWNFGINTYINDFPIDKKIDKIRGNFWSLDLLGLILFILV